MLHAYLAVYVISFSVGLVVLTLSLLAYARSGRVEFRSLAFLFVAAVFLLLGRAIGIYEEATVEAVFGGYRSVLSTVFTAPGNGLLVAMIFVIVREVDADSFPRFWYVVSIAFVVGAFAMGVLRELSPDRLFWVLNNAGLIAVLVIAIVHILSRGERTGDSAFLTFLRSLAVCAAVAAPLMAAQVIVQATRIAPPVLREFPLVQTICYFVVVGFALSYLARYLFEPESISAFQLPAEITRQYGISPRECEIITMLVRGYTNRVIGEKLFISSTTVKNHIYHIYQKTGVKNKIQLINLINSPK